MRTFTLPHLLSLPRTTDLFIPFFFLYLVTLHADQLSMHVGSYALRFNNFLALALAILVALRFRSRFFKVDSSLALALLALLFSVVISMGFSPSFKRCFLYLVQFCFTMVAYFWLPYQLLTSWRDNRLYRYYWLSFVVVGTYAFLQLFTYRFGDPFVTQVLPGGFGRPSAFNYEPSYYVLYMTPFIVYETLLYIAKETTTSLKRLALYTLFYFASASASAVLSYTIFLGLTLGYRRYRRSLMAFLLKFSLLFIPLILFGGAFAAHYYLRAFTGVKSDSGHERWEGVKHGIELFKKRPLLGYGLGGVPRAKIEQGLLYSDHRELAMHKEDLKIAESTNVATEVLSSLGILGAFAIIAIIASYCVAYLKYRRSAEDDALFLSVIVMLITWQINQSILRPYCWFHLAVACAHLQTMRQSQQCPLPKDETGTLDKVP